MDGAGRILGAAAAVALLVLPGCLEPFQSHVDPAILPRGWERADCPRATPSAPSPCGGGKHEVDYTFDQGAGPPYRGILQVLSLRDLGRRSTEDLFALARDAVEKGAAAAEIDTDASRHQEGSRILRNGLVTRWFTDEGNVTQAGTLLSSNVRVRIVGEVGYDGRSQTSIVAIGIVQVAVKQCTPVLIGTPRCTFANENYATWNAMVGDEAGHIGGAFSRTGLIDHLVTHG